MRRHPLAIGSALLVVVTVMSGCITAGPPPTQAPPSAVAVTITSTPGDTTAFEPAETTVRTSSQIALTFRNGSSLSHNLVFTGALTAATRTIVEPGTSDQLLLMPPGPGTYWFVCTIHDGMAGSLIVQAVARISWTGAGGN